MPDSWVPRARGPSFFHEELPTVDLLSDQTPIDDQSLRVPMDRRTSSSAAEITVTRLGDALALKTRETIDALQIDGRTPARLLLVEDDAVLADAFSSLLSSSGHEVVVAHSTDAAQQILSRTAFDVIISDILLPGTSGLALARNIRAKDRQQQIILMTADAAIEHAVGAVEVGAFRFLLKPVGATALEEAVREALREHKRAERARRVLESHPVATTDDLIDFGAALDTIWMAYQPIVSWRAQRVVGREALVRSTYPHLTNPAMIIRAAKKLDEMASLGRVIRLHVAEAIAQMPEHEKVFINVSAEDLEDETFLDAGDPLSRFASRTVLELSEEAALDRVEGLSEKIAVLRERNFHIALDDLGSGYAGLNSIAILKPEIVKLDMELTRAVERDVRKQEIVRSMVSFCQRTSTMLVAEGVETVAEREMLLELGCDFFQGYLFARPQPKIDGAIRW